MQFFQQPAFILSCLAIACLGTSNPDTRYVSLFDLIRELKIDNNDRFICDETTQAFMFSRLIPKLTGLKNFEVNDSANSGKCRLSYFDPDVMVPLEVDAIFNLNNKSPEFRKHFSNFIKWAENNSLFADQANVENIVQGVFSPITSKASAEEAGEAIKKCTLDCFKRNHEFCSAHNYKVPIAIKNMFPRDNMENLMYSYLVPATYFAIEGALNPEDIKTIKGFPLDLAKLRSLSALLMFSEGKKYFTKNAKHYFSSRPFKFGQPPCLFEILSDALLTQNSFLSDFFGSSDMNITYTPEEVAWLVNNYGGQAKNLQYMTETLSKWYWTSFFGISMANKDPKITTRMLSCSFTENCREVVAENGRVVFKPLHPIQVFAINCNCKSRVDLNVKISERPDLTFTKECLEDTYSVQLDVKTPTVLLIFPKDVKVTNLMINILKNWSLNNAIKDELTLARMIILMDQVTIVRYQPK